MAISVEPAAGVPAPIPVEPAVGAPAAAAAAAAAPAPAETEGADLPDKVIQIPAIQGLLAGTPAAVSSPVEQFEASPEGQIISENSQALLGAGFGVYKSLDGSTGVIFNSHHISPDAIKQADQAGTLPEIAPPFDQVNQELAQAGGQSPVFGAGPTGGAAPAPAPAIGAMPSPAPNKLIAAKNRNLAVGSPTSGPQPGAGRLLNSILKPVL